ncbi:MAG: hypothetical protein DIZ80_10080 [endosymbiont of Galathealinum brachiosum]|uniref:Lipoprotein n=1 Tax=endosymbiont of Galathealinum brachiosum TaxID=2200906 RepID=A0A370DCM0_9GAMM|nr:MAG: hypothetical protein DIZ80_10080 [endosymbiont of Galathealinum brachiosum]
MKQIKFMLIFLLALVSNISCDTGNNSNNPTESLKVIKKQTPVSLDLSMPENKHTIDDKFEKLETNDAIDNMINKHLNKPQNKDYKISGDIHLDPNENTDKLMLEKVDGGQINLEFNFE